MKEEGANVFHFETGEENHLTFSDLFDINHWNHMSSKYKSSMLVTKEFFLQNATKDIVYVQIMYASSHYKCVVQSEEALKSRKWYIYLKEKGFHINKTVCINFNKDRWNEEKFKKAIFETAKHKVSILFDYWYGIRDGRGRINLRGSQCHASFARLIFHLDIVPTPPLKITYSPPSSTSFIVPSNRISNYYKEFLSKFHLSEGNYYSSDGKN